MPYTVSSYANFDIPEPRWVDHGTFESADEAVACANRIVRRSLESLYLANRKPDAQGFVRRVPQLWRCSISVR